MNELQDELDLDWLAFCYAAGELDAEQAAKFEALLAESQDTRERLAAMVALAEHMAVAPLFGVTLAVPAQHVRLANRQVLTRLMWLASAAAVLFVAIWLAGDGAESETGRTYSGEIALADVWANSVVEPVEPIADDSERGDLLPATSLVDATDVEVGENEVVDIPDWMIAALGGENAEGDSISEEEAREFEEMFPEAFEDAAFQDG